MQLAWLLPLNATAEPEAYKSFTKTFPITCTTTLFFPTWKIIGYIKYIGQYSSFKEDTIVKWIEKVG